MAFEAPKALLVTAVAFLVGCAVPPAASVPPLVGKVVFPEPYQVQAEMKEVARAATVSLIDTVENQTIASTVTDAAGTFTLTFGSSFVATAGRTYALEAVKGLQNNRPGNDAARIRTLARFSGTWATLTAGGLVVSRATTALALIVAARNLDGGALIGKLNPADSTFDATGTNVLQAEYETVLGYVTTSLKRDLDPFDNIVYQGSNYTLKYSDSDAPSILRADPNPGTIGTEVTIVGQRFGTSIGANTIKFNGTPAAASAASATSLTVKVPAGATTGNLTVETSAGTGSIAYTVIPDFDGRFTF